MGSPHVQCNMDPGRLFAPHNDLNELMALFGFQLCYAGMSRTSRTRGSDGLTGISQGLKGNRIDKLPELCEGRTIFLSG